MIPLASRISLARWNTSRRLARRAHSSGRDHNHSVAFIGLGNMGLPMALNLKNHLPSVVAYDTSRGARDRAATKGLTLADSTEDIAETGADIIFTMLPNDRAVIETMDQLQKAARGCGKSQVIVDCSTVSPLTSQQCQTNWKGHDGRIFIDAPVSGGVKGATDGSLTFMVGCELRDVPQIAQSCFRIMGKRFVHCGGPGAGSATKLCNNLALAVQMIGICEAMNLGEALGVDPVILADVMNTSTAKCWSSEICNPHPVVAASKNTGDSGPPAAHDYEGGFATKLMLKDLGLAVRAADTLNVVVPLAASSKELYGLAAKAGLSEKDFGVMLRFLQGRTK